MEWIIAQQNPLDNNVGASSQVVGDIPELAIILIILLMLATVVALVLFLLLGLLKHLKQTTLYLCISVGIMQVCKVTKS